MTKATSASTGPQAVPGARRRRGPSGHADDAHLEPTSLTRSGREAGAWVYVDAWTLRAALEAAGIPVSTSTRELEATRHVLEGHRSIAQVLLKIRRRPAP